MRKATWSAATAAVLLSASGRAQCEWTDVHTTGPALTSWVETIELHDNGGGEKLYVGGLFDSGSSTTAGPPSWVARLNAQGKWGAIGNPLGDRVQTLLSYDLGNGPRLLAGGRFAERVMSWDASATWNSIGGGVSGPSLVRASALFDDGGGEKLYIGGHFDQVGGVPAKGVACWDGTSWSGLAGGLQMNYADEVIALLAWDDGHGEKLYVVGDFDQVDGQPANGAACWDGTAWTIPWPLGTSEVEIEALETFDDGTGEALYVGGEFTELGGVAAAGIARWVGGSITPVGGGISPASPFAGGSVMCLEVFDDGSGAQLYAGGFFSAAGGVPANHFARWDGTAWSRPSAYEPECCVYAMLAWDDGSGPALFVGGAFTTVGPLPMNYVARYRPSFDPGVTYCTAGTSSSGCRAQISTCGTPSASLPSGFDVRATGVEGLRSGLFFFGANGRQAKPWGSGTSYQCVTPPVQRGKLLQFTGTAGQCNGAQIYDLNRLWTEKPTLNPGQGATVQAQYWHRDPFNTSNQKTSLSNAVEFQVGP